jgi:hypothetical protein
MRAPATAENLAGAECAAPAVSRQAYSEAVISVTVRE